MKEHKNAGGGGNVGMSVRDRRVSSPSEVSKRRFIFLYINIYIKGALPVCVWSPGGGVQCPYIQSKSRGAESMYRTSE